MQNLRTRIDGLRNDLQLLIDYYTRILMTSFFTGTATSIAIPGMWASSGKRTAKSPSLSVTGASGKK
jgi:hypothetical protein